MIFDSMWWRQVKTTQDRCSGHPVYRLESTALRTDRIYFLVYRTILYVIFRSVGPLLIIAVVNVRLAAALSVVRRRRRRLLSTGARRARDNRSNMTMMLLVVVSMFVVCELPDVGLRLAVTVYEFESTVRLHMDAVRYAHVASNALHVVNASVNFIIYCLVGRKFRRLLGRRLTGCRAPTVTASEEVAEDWAAGTPAVDGGSECENVAMVPPPATGRDVQATTSVVAGTADQCIIVVHQPHCTNIALTPAAVINATSEKLWTLYYPPLYYDNIYDLYVSVRPIINKEVKFSFDLVLLTTYNSYNNTRNTTGKIASIGYTGKREDLRINGKSNYVITQ